MKLEAEKYLETLERDKEMFEIQNDISRHLRVPDNIMDSLLVAIEETKSDIGKKMIYNLDDESADIWLENEEFRRFQLEALVRMNEILNEMVEKAKEVYGLH